MVQLSSFAQVEIDGSSFSGLASVVEGSSDQKIRRAVSVGVQGCQRVAESGSESLTCLKKNV
jgi:hypothetical protein